MIREAVCEDSATEFVEIGREAGENIVDECVGCVRDASRLENLRKETSGADTLNEGFDVMVGGEVQQVEIVVPCYMYVFVSVKRSEEVSIFDYEPI